MTQDEAREKAWKALGITMWRPPTPKELREVFDDAYEAGKAAGIAQGTLDGYDAGFKAGYETKNGTQQTSQLDSRDGAVHAAEARK